MKLFLKRDISSGEPYFLIFDELGAEKYRAVPVKSKVTSKLHLALCDSEQNVKAKIRRLPVVGANVFVLRVGKSHVNFAIVRTKNEILSYFYGNNWHINGSIAAKNFTVIDVDKTVIMEHRKHSDCCTLEIPKEENELYCVCAAICANTINTVEKPAVQAANI